ncbi:hypothetical protein AC1031_007891 [Aphanomyces cochlioides]|nr:hypothetical protein AC1031_007891 [Aphanomyces cochlioides]
MNGVLSTLTWGTWDVDSAELMALKGAEGRKKEAKRQLRGVPSARTNESAWFEQLLERLEQVVDVEYSKNPLRPAAEAPSPTVIPWNELPKGIHPKDGHLPLERVQRKRHQVDNLAFFLGQILRDGDRVVEFCAGSGYVALPLACLFPKCHFVLLDMKKLSLDIAMERITASKLTNVSVFCGKVDDYMEPFDVGIALHACGEATDMVLEKCLVANAAYVLAPCCVGKIKHSELIYPRSNAINQALSRTEYQIVAKAADFGHAAVSLNAINIARRRCKSFVEADRNLRARETKGYHTAMYIMHPFNATPKNDILVGVPATRNHKTVSSHALSKEKVYEALYGEIKN